MAAAFTPRIDHFALSVADLGVTADWYREKLGFVEDFRYSVPEMGLRAVFLVLGDFRLEIFQMSESRPPDADEQDLGRAEFGWRAVLLLHRPRRRTHRAVPDRRPPHRIPMRLGGG